MECVRVAMHDSQFIIRLCLFLGWPSVHLLSKICSLAPPSLRQFSSIIHPSIHLFSYLTISCQLSEFGSQVWQPKQSQTAAQTSPWLPPPANLDEDQVVSKPDKYNLCSESWVCPKASSSKHARITSIGFFQCGEAVALLWTPFKWLNSSLCLQVRVLPHFVYTRVSFSFLKSVPRTHMHG